MMAKASAAGMMKPSPTGTPGTLPVIMIEPMMRLIVPPTPRTPLGTFNSSTSSADAEQHQQQSGRVHRQDLQRKEREQQAERARDTRQHRAGIPEFHRQSDHAERHQQVSDLRDARWR